MASLTYHPLSYLTTLKRCFEEWLHCSPVVEEKGTEEKDKGRVISDIIEYHGTN